MNDTLKALRARIQEIEGRPVGEARTLPSGNEALDAALRGGLPHPGLVEVSGKRGAGAMRLALQAAAACTQRGERVAWVDSSNMFYPPTAAALGVTLSQLVLVTPTEQQASWSVEQLLRSGCLPLVVALEPPVPSGAGARWARAAGRGSCTLMVLRERSRETLPAGLRLHVGDGQITIQRHRNCPSGKQVPLPDWPEGLDPWA